jgi:methionyl-tRNA formyltransferase
MNIIFAGSPDIAATVLEFLSKTNHQISLVLTQQDALGGRGKKIIQSPVKEKALSLGLSLYQPTTLKDPFVIDTLQKENPDLMIVVGYGKILPEAILSLPKFGCVNLHVSLLPRWRGASPIAQAILAGDEKTGITLMQMDKGMDTGDILLQDSLVITPTDTTESLSHRVIALGLPLLDKLLKELTLGKILPQKQNQAQVTLAPKIDMEAALLNFQLPAEVLERQIRAFYPWPVAYFMKEDERLRVFSAEVLPTEVSLTPGKIQVFHKNGLDIETGNGILRITRLQKAGGKILSIADFYNGQKSLFEVGKIL